MKSHTYKAKRALAAWATCMSLVASGTCLATEQAKPNLSGVWQVVTPVVQLKTTDGKEPPLLPDAKKLYGDRIAKYKAGNAKQYDPSLQTCKPLGEPRTGYESPEFPFEIVQRDDSLLFGYTWNRMVRVVYMKDQFDDIAGPTYMATSIGKWDGNTLVVRAKGLNDSTLLDASGMPHSDQLELTEKFSLKDGGKLLEENIQFNDPKVFAKPWNAVVTYKKLPAGTRIKEDICLERLNITLKAPDGVR